MKRLYQIEIHITNRECRGAFLKKDWGFGGVPVKFFCHCEEPGDEAILEANG